MKNFDLAFLNNEICLLAGVDEAGRGPLAGPVVAAAVIFSNETNIEGINDSKKISEKNREKLFSKIVESSLAYGIGIIENEEIDKINILQATLKAMNLAVQNLSMKPDLVIVDGDKIFPSKNKVISIIKGDSKSYSIAAASILAKVTRDRMMIEASKEYPYYGREKNKGYGSKAHIESIKKYGISPFHRKSFLRNITNDNN